MLHHRCGDVIIIVIIIITIIISNVTIIVVGITCVVTKLVIPDVYRSRIFYGDFVSDVSKPRKDSRRFPRYEEPDVPSPVFIYT